MKFLLKKNYIYAQVFFLFASAHDELRKYGKKSSFYFIFFLFKLALLSFLMNIIILNSL
jgi:hypothetical protein